MDERAIRLDERRQIAQEIRDEAHALIEARREAFAESGGAGGQPSSPLSASSALALADWIEQRLFFPPEALQVSRVDD